jgi:hypothetical protein
MEIVIPIDGRQIMLHGTMSPDFSNESFELMYYNPDGFWIVFRTFPTLREALVKIIQLTLIASNATTLADLKNKLDTVKDQLKIIYDTTLDV